MKDPNVRPTGDWKPSDGNGLSDATEVTREAVEEGEECIRTRPLTAIGAAFGGGLLLGVLVGWKLAEEKHEDIRDRCQRLLRDWQRRFHVR